MSITPIQPGTAYATQPASTKQTTGTEKSGQTQAVNSPVSAIVDIKSGWELMLSRLWEVDDPNYEPPYVSQFERDSYRGKVYSFLNYEDRKLVSELYEYARDNGISFNKVDDFAFYLSNYRSCPDVNPGYLGFIDYSDNPGEFRPEDEKIIQRLLTSKAIKDTTIDHGFLNLMFNSPNKTAHGGIDFEFLQEVVFSHSASGSDGAADPDAVVPLRPWQIVEMF
ncbi:MAG: hypothetical protein LBQ81_14260, partial [Zoogloeaceae bacterium]|nr:hypothetical protein [Zoogloeaceae bacterium]